MRTNTPHFPDISDPVVDLQTLCAHLAPHTGNTGHPGITKADLQAVATLADRFPREAATLALMIHVTGHGAFISRLHVGGTR